MLLSPLPRRHAIGALVGALLMLGAPQERVAAQGGCEFGEDGNDQSQFVTLPNGGRITYVSNPHFVCPDGVQIWADSAVAYSADAMSHLMGAVRFVDRTRELRADEARYVSTVGRLQANGNVVVVDRADDSRVENGDLVYLRQTDFRAEESMTVTTGRDGIRPRATIPPPAPDSAAADSTTTPDSTAAERDESPYIVVGDRIVFSGSSYFSSTGDVEIERDSLFAFADSAEYVEASERLVLVGSARVVSSDYVLVGRTITMGTDAAGTNEIRAVRDALLTGDDLVLTAPLIRLYLTEGAVERLVAVPLPPGADEEGVPTDTALSPDEAAAAARPTEPDSAELARPIALAERFELTADSLELSAPGGVVDQIFAAGRARSVSEARDSLNVEALPELARQDWLEGDTIVITLVPPPSDTVPAAHTVTPAPTATEEEAEQAYEIERIVARVGARSLYRLPPQDSTARSGVDLPAVHYVVGDEITIHMREGEVEAMEVVGQTRGVHLEPLGRAESAAAHAAAAPPADLGPGSRP
jgi:lipopolysaccharide export system protein LptA